MAELYFFSSRAARGMRSLLTIACFASTAAAGCRDLDDDCHGCFLQELLGKEPCAFCVAYGEQRDAHGNVRPVEHTRCTPISERSTDCPSPPWSVLTKPTDGVDQQCATLKERLK